jgi:hypothetical protein
VARLVMVDAWSLWDSSGKPVAWCHTPLIGLGPQEHEWCADDPRWREFLTWLMTRHAGWCIEVPRGSHALRVLEPVERLLDLWPQGAVNRQRALCCLQDAGGRCGTR